MFCCTLVSARRSSGVDISVWIKETMEYWHCQIVSAHSFPWSQIHEWRGGGGPRRVHGISKLCSFTFLSPAKLRTPPPTDIYVIYQPPEDKSQIKWQLTEWIERNKIERRAAQPNFLGGGGGEQHFVFKGMDIKDLVEIVILKYNQWPQFFLLQNVRNLGKGTVLSYLNIYFLFKCFQKSKFNLSKDS